MKTDGSGIILVLKAVSSRLHESGMWQNLYRLEIEMVRVLRGQTGILGGATGILGSATGRNLGALKGLPHRGRWKPQGKV
jgi:hypothetical protein